MFTETGGRTAQSESSSFSQLPSLFKRFFDQFLKLFDTQLALFKAELKGGVKIYARQKETTCLPVTKGGKTFRRVVSLPCYPAGMVHQNDLIESTGRQYLFAQG